MVNLKMIFKLLLCAVSTLLVVAGQTTPVKLLVLVPWPSDRNDSGWDAGLDALAGGRVAVNEINNRTDILRDYHIELVVPEYGHEPCGFIEASQGLMNFVQNGIDPPEQVLAVLGLFCSTSTKEISSLAGHDSVQLIQLTAANSPIFHPDNITLLDSTLQPTYPHLWQFLTSASVYADMMVELMDRFNWKDIVVIYAVENRFQAGVANVLMKRAASSILFSSSSKELFHDSTLDLIEEHARVIFLAAPLSQTVSLLCRAAERRMFYPDYMWITVDHLLPFFNATSTSTSQCNIDMLHRVLNGSLLSHFSLEPHGDMTLDVNGDTYSTYKSKYDEELEIVANEYNQTLSGDHQYAGVLYDQVWAFALALNSSLPELSERNLSVSDIGSLGYSKAKEILESKLSQLDFRGASGHIRFTDEREVSTSIDLYQVINGQQKSVGNCTTNQNSVLYCNITLIETPPSSEFDKVYIQVPLEVAIGLLIVTLLVPLFVTSILVLFIYHRNRPEIKASSWKLSIMFFIACYILCMDMILTVLQSWRNHLVYCYIQPLLLFNGLNLFMVTLFLKILRVYHIFHNRRLEDLGWRCSNGFLIIVNIALTAVPNIYLVLWYSLDEKILKEDSQLTLGNSVRHFIVIQTCQSGRNEYLEILILVPCTYLIFFALGNIVLATRTAKIYRNFKDTKKINFVMATIFVTSVSLGVIIAFKFVSAENNNIIYRCFISFMCIYLYSGIIVGLVCIFILIPKLWWIKSYTRHHIQCL